MKKLLLALLLVLFVGGLMGCGEAAKGPGENAPAEKK